MRTYLRRKIKVQVGQHSKFYCGLVSAVTIIDDAYSDFFTILLCSASNLGALTALSSFLTRKRMFMITSKHQI